MTSQHDSTDINALQEAISIVVRSLRQPRLREQIGQRANVRLDAAHYALLPIIARTGQARVSDLAGSLRVEIPTVSRQLQALERGGLIERSAVPDDRRVSLISLTPKGVDLYQAIHLGWATTIDEVLTDWDSKDVQILAQLFTRFATDLHDIAQSDRD